MYVPRTVATELPNRSETVFASTPQSWRRALALVDARKVDLPPLVSAVIPLSAWERAFADLRASRGIKIVFDPRL